MPPAPAAGVPASTPVVPKAVVLRVKVTPAGSVPDSLSVGAGVPLGTTMKLPALPTVNVVALALVICGP